MQILFQPIILFIQKQLISNPGQQMSQHKQKQLRKHKQKPSPSPQPSHLQLQIKSLIKSLNNFLKQHFDYSYTNLPQYSEQVKQYFIQQSTNSNYSCLLGTFLSKISNMLQPFLQVNHNIKNASQNYAEEYRLREEISCMKGKMQKMDRKICRLKEEIKQYKITSGKLTNFVYMLRVNNIDVDSLYEKGCRQPEREVSLSRQSNTQNMRHHQQIISNFQTQ